MMDVTFETLEALSDAIERHEAALRRETERYHAARHTSGLTLCAHLDRIIRMHTRRHDTLCRLWLELRGEFDDRGESPVTRALLAEAEQAVKIRLREYEAHAGDDLPF